MLLSIIVIAALVGLNFEKFTGQYTVKEGIASSQADTISKVYVSTDPSIVKMDNPSIEIGSKLYFTVESGVEGCKRVLSVHKKSSGSKVAQIELNQNCGGNKCRANQVTWADYRVPADWEGEYCGKVFDYGINDFVEPVACFTVI